ncbi:hypothetical protein K488DRAFT_74526 [Vararia minispora EC-137]|uniref:Uncharacterized protein n=1 Tax=Vararia minispora EC-137 TaxID=1314806 RepID=A0ACB8Q704_9AGAM|nr:hypothetical protein K488DRAFT_74526 [Vararia minispora EC-137]
MPATPEGISRAQNEILIQLCKNDFAALVNAKRREGKGGWKDIKPWVKDQLKKIRDRKEFSDITDQAIQTVIFNKFRNYYNQNLNKCTEPEGASHSHADPRLLDIFFPLVKGRRLFEADIKEELKTESNSIAEYQKLLSQKWDALDDKEQHAYIIRAESMRGDLDFNLSLLESAMGPVLDGVCQSGRLGQSVMMLAVGARESNGDLSCRFYHGIFSKDIASIAEDEDSESAWNQFRDAWARYAKGHVPALPENATVPDMTFEIPLNSQGSPIFPSVDLDRAPPEHLRRIVSMYFKALWEHCKHVAPLDEGAWTAIAKEPSKFYDVNKFGSLNIRNPARLKRREVDDLAEHLLSSSSASTLNPFCFHPPVLTSSATFSPRSSRSGSPTGENWSPLENDDISPTVTSAGNAAEPAPVDNTVVQDKPVESGMSGHGISPGLRNTPSPFTTQEDDPAYTTVVDEGPQQPAGGNTSSAKHGRGRPRKPQTAVPALDEDNAVDTPALRRGTRKRILSAGENRDNETGSADHMQPAKRARVASAAKTGETGYEFKNNAIFRRTSYRYPEGSEVEVKALEIALKDPAYLARLSFNQETVWTSSSCRNLIERESPSMQRERRVKRKPI